MVLRIHQLRMDGDTPAESTRPLSLPLRLSLHSVHSSSYLPLSPPSPNPFIDIDVSALCLHPSSSLLLLLLHILLHFLIMLDASIRFTSFPSGSHSTSVPLRIGGVCADVRWVWQLLSCFSRLICSIPERKLSKIYSFVPVTAVRRITVNEAH